LSCKEVQNKTMTAGRARCVVFFFSVHVLLPFSAPNSKSLGIADVLLALRRIAPVPVQANVVYARLVRGLGSPYRLRKQTKIQLWNEYLRASRWITRQLSHIQNWYAAISPNSWFP
jgi:hypothetical protein